METILVQEPDAATFDVVSIALQMKGYRVYSLTDQQENMLEMIGRHHPKLILLDCWVSHDTGKQISHWIKAHFPHLPLIAFSCDSEIDHEYQQLGFDGYLKKPFDLQDLYQTIRRHLPGQIKRRAFSEPA